MEGNKRNEWRVNGLPHETLSSKHIILTEASIATLDALSP